MAVLVVLCGHPCSGKSSFATLLQTRIAEMAEAQGSAGASGDPSIPNCVIIDEPSLHLTRRDAYKDNFSEKNLRAALRSAVDRTLNTGAIVIADSNNFIKGFRYELWCAARAAKARYCLVYCQVTASHARMWNSQREDGYPEEIFEDLVRRLEYPNPKNRWDAPYFVVRPQGIDVSELQREKDNAKLYEWPADLKPLSSDMEHMNLSALPHDKDAAMAKEQGGAGVENASEMLPEHVVARVIREVVLVTQRPPKNKVRHKNKSRVDDQAADPGQEQGRLNPTPATSAEKLSTTNLRHELDRATLQVVNAIISAQAQGLGKVEVSDSVSMRLNRTVSVAELRRWRQQFLRMTGSLSGNQVTSAEAAQKLFVEHLKSLGV